ncbi:shikimate dehydrogenase [Fodinibacter luteus]|uniref:Shikimate dehydrogenase (NADP(+)) n=1 Tax=Fodinibacter luteus TaxID=552064 RepID=A0ABP8KPV7_9MICO
MSTATFLGVHTGSFSTPAVGNPTVAMVEAAYRHHGLDARYLNCDVAPGSLGDAVAGARAMGWAGFNCSLPHKVAVIDHLDLLAESAEVIGAVNTVVATDGDLVGHNTDGQGFVESLRTVVDPTGLEVVVLGAGGAARAVAVETALAGAASVTVVNRNARRGEELARVVTAGTAVPATFVAWDRTYAVPDTTDVLVNATSVGFGDGDALVDVDLDSLGDGLVVADVVVSPPRTALLRAAAARGAVTLDGLGMLVGQGALAVRHWTGVEPDRDVMRAAVERALGV